MQTLKVEAINAISQLPETATMDDMMYRLYIIDKIRHGQEAVKNGDTIPAERLLNEINSW